MPLIFWLDVAALSLSVVLATALTLMVLGAGPDRVLNRSFALFTLLEASWSVLSLLLRLSLWLEMGNPLLLSELAALAFSLMGPALLIFTVRYVGYRTRWPDRLAVLGFLIMGLLLVPLLRHQLVSNPQLYPNGSTTMDISPWAVVIAILPIFYFLWSLILFWRKCREAGEFYLALSVLILLAGFMVGGILEIRFPVLSFTNTLSIALLGYGVVSRQLLNPLAELTAELENKVQARTWELERAYQEVGTRVDERTAELRREIAERERIERALRQERDLVARITETSPAGIIVVDRGGRIVFANTRAEQVLGLKKDEITQRTYNDPEWHISRYDGTFFPDVELPFRRIMDGASAVSDVRHAITWPDGRRVLLSINAASLVDGQGRVSGMVATVEDVTGRVQAEEDLRRYTAELEARNEELGAFAHTVAHDLQTPIGVVAGFVEALENEYGSLSREEVARHLQIIDSHVYRISSIIKELLLLASVRQMDVETAPLDMAAIVGEATQRLSHMIQEQGAEIILPDAWLEALGYAPWVEEVWVNYLSNALKYGGRPPRVELGSTLHTEGDRDVVRFWVRDNGAGLTLEERARLFVPFTQLARLRFKGHGLGLSIVGRIVERLGGQVGVESSGVPGEGSTFFFTLPASERHSDPEPQQPGESEAAHHDA